MAAAWQPLPESGLPAGHTSGMSSHHCERARKLDRDPRLVERELADLDEAKRFVLSPEDE